MTLSNRLTAYFLIWLAVALAGFSVLLYSLVRVDLYSRLDAYLQASLDTLMASCEVEANGVEWEAKSRPLASETLSAKDELAWLVLDEHGNVIERSPSRKPEWLKEHVEAVLSETRVHSVRHREATWQITGRRMAPENPDTIELGHSESHPKYRSLTLVIAVSRAGVDTSLHQLTALMLALSVGLLTVAVLVGRRLCRRALAPVTEMAVAARSFRAADAEERLPVRPTSDEVEELGKSFNELLDRLQDAFERQRRFSGEASHQLRTPMTAIRGQIDVALRRERSAEEYRRVLSLVDEQFHHMQSIVEMLLFLARADSETAKPELTPLDLRVWLPDILQAWADEGQRQRIRAAIEIEQASVLAHAGLLGQLLSNLIDNGLKHSLAQSEVVVRLARVNNRTVLEVIDRGSGIAEEDLPHIFEAFFRSASSRVAGLPGVGLGLAVAKRIASVLGATLEVESKLGNGSTFRLEFSEM